MKKLIKEEVSKQSNNRQNAPSIVVAQPIDKKNEKVGVKFSKKEMGGNSSVGHVSSDSNSSTLMELNSSYRDKDISADRWSREQVYFLFYFIY